MDSCMSEIRIGISGWTYTPWRGVFYPEDWPQKKELAYASRQVSSIEINGTFYSLQRPESYHKWHEETPDDFVFSVKGGRFITHLRRLKEVEKPLANFFASDLTPFRRNQDCSGPRLIFIGVRSLCSPFFPISSAASAHSPSRSSVRCY